MPATPIYAIPYQTVDDQPNGPLLGQQLAEKVEAELARIDAALAPLATRALWARRTTDSAAAGGSLTADTALTLAAPANAVLEYVAYIVFRTASGTADMSVDIAVPSGAAVVSGSTFELTGTSGPATTGPSGSVNLIPATTSPKLLRITALITMGATAGNIQFRRSGTGVIIAAGSYTRADQRA